MELIYKRSQLLGALLERECRRLLEGGEEWFVSRIEKAWDVCSIRLRALCIICVRRRV